MAATLTSLCINVDPELYLPNSRGAGRSPPVHLKGRYVAVPDPLAGTSDPRAYELHEADEQWQAKPTVVASVFLVVDGKGGVQIS